LQRFVSLFRVGAVNQDVPAFFSGVAEDGERPELFLDNPFQVDAEPSEEHEDVVQALVVGYYDIRLVSRDVLPAYNIDPHRSYEAVEARPPDARGPVGGPVVEQDDDDHAQADEETGGESQQRQVDKPLIRLVEEPEDLVALPSIFHRRRPSITRN
jgi:hypothetical protein